jgi:hypothetical protein
MNIKNKTSIDNIFFNIKEIFKHLQFKNGISKTNLDQ